MFVVGKNKENRSALITVAPEKREHRSDGLSIADNDASLAPGAGFTTAFVGDWSRARLNIGTNRLGPGITPIVNR